MATQTLDGPEGFRVTKTLNEEFNIYEYRVIVDLKRSQTLLMEDVKELPEIEPAIVAYALDRLIEEVEGVIKKYKEKTDE